jgi:Na+-transporting NADH:ubiquinone oxidoreductase subunit A
MAVNLKLKRGLNIKLKGSPAKVLHGNITPSVYGIRPADFHGITPKLAVKPGDAVKTGTTLFTDKSRTEIRFASPASGIVRAINRGEQRRILEIVIDASGDDYVDFGKADPGNLTAEQIINKLLESGLWPAIRQRPYHIIASPKDQPKSIFISAFDTSPLAPDLNFVMDNSSAETFYTGLGALSKLTSGKINLVMNGIEQPSSVLAEAPGVEKHYISGPHPAGNVGVHIHHIDPVNKGETVWTVNLQDVLAIGRLFKEGIYRHDRLIAFSGSEVLKPGYFGLRSGASIRDLATGRVNEGSLRFISGNVLTGTKIEADGFFGYYDNMVTVIPEGNYYEFFGWIKPGFSSYSFSRTFLSSLTGKKEFVLDTNLHGGERAFVVTGQYEKVVPMDIYPMQLLKAIIAGDIDNMENLGIYEIAEEDFALCEFICPSKIDIQSILRNGIDLMVKEMN